MKKKNKPAVGEKIIRGVPDNDKAAKLMVCPFPVRNASKVASMITWRVVRPGVLNIIHHENLCP